MQEKLAELRALDKEIVLLEHIAALLEWDEETQMPAKGLEGRTEQISLLQGMIYDKKTSPLMGDLLQELGDSESSVSDADRAILRIYSREYRNMVKVPRRLVLELSEAQSRGQAAWTQARKESDFTSFRPFLERIIRLKRELSEALGYEGHPYDALVDQYEPGMTAKKVDDVFTPLKRTIVDLLHRISERGPVDDSFLYGKYPQDLQDRFGKMVLQDMGFDFSRANMSEAVHPFTTTVGYDDIRITTRYDEPSVSSPLFSTIHEGGHALYELGASNEVTRGTVLAQGVSLSVHESQSRLWENIIGRSAEFWDHYFPIIKDLFPEQLHGVDELMFLQGINKVEPSMIRVNADEVTYSLHIILRFELEKALISGDLEVKDIPSAWNSGMRELFGITPANDAEGVLQDVHWSAGLVGYFPTYALGNLFGAQFFHALLQDQPNTREQIASGNLLSVQQWLNEHIYRHGSIYTAQDLLERVTGESLDASYFAEYLGNKYMQLFSV